MANEILTGATGFAGIVIGAIASALGLNYRLNRIENLQEKMVFKDVCVQCQEKSTIQFTAIRGTLAEIKHSIDIIRDRLDK